MHTTVGSQFLHNLLRTVEKMGCPIELDPSRYRGQSRLPAELLLEAWALAVAKTGDNDLGLHLGEKTVLGRWGIVEMLAMQSASLEQAVADAIEHWRGVGFDDLLIGLRKRGFLRVIHMHSPSIVHRHVAESDMVYLLRLMRAVYGAQLHPKAVTFVHQRPASLSEHRRLFGVAPRFGQSTNGLHFDVRDLRNEKSETICAQVLEYVPTNLAQATLASCANHLGMSSRTLQRKLASEHSSFSELLDQARKAQAHALLTESTLPFNRVSALLGYAEPSPFHNAVRRWFGDTPRSVREGASRNR